MSCINIKDLFKLAWLRAKEIEGVKDDDPVVLNVQSRVIRTIAEFEVSRSHAEKSFSPADLYSELSEDDRDEPTLSEVA